MLYSSFHVQPFCKKTFSRSSRKPHFSPKTWFHSKTAHFGNISPLYCRHWMFSKHVWALNRTFLHVRQSQQCLVWLANAAWDPYSVMRMYVYAFGNICGSTFRFSTLKAPIPAIEREGKREHKKGEYKKKERKRAWSSGVGCLKSAFYALVFMLKLCQILCSRYGLVAL